MRVDRCERDVRVPRAAAVAGGGAPGRRAVGSQKRDAGVAARRLWMSLGGWRGW